MEAMRQKNDLLRSKTSQLEAERKELQKQAQRHLRQRSTTRRLARGTFLPVEDGGGEEVTQLPEEVP
eukprot:CAMPEP_0204526884 /NCGR_PEP_ID=MMETSP0661-20131031/8680_1 /ASSEMBLY_ACC=CAM_ASM_000606 /TAXON_ID=109239 /ORGANISM="Alexandrium margalefi, Strain AMGDE01CS-322" /LENGTH=66 /DNA_ID=CAMNT_0051532749 /DNA_START=29 /DNA_END=225 /DNA_ORIENTATION=-